MVGGVRRVALVEAAYARIASGGLEGLRLRAVAEDVGIDHSTLHHHVKTKQELVLAVAEYATRRFHHTAPVDEDPVRALHDHLSGIRELMEVEPELFVVVAELDLRARRDPTVRRALEGFESAWRRGLVALVERGVATGAWCGADAEATAELIVATAKGVRGAPKQAGPVFEHLENLLTKGATRCTS